MKEIKCRAWSQYRKVWDYFNPSNITMYLQSWQLHVINGDEFYFFTGLHDSKGRELYEGDLITSPLIKDEFLPCLVKFGKYTDIAEAGCTSHTNIGFYIQDSTGQQTGLLNEELLIEWDSFEIIGNIYMNPELVEKK